MRENVRSFFKKSEQFELVTKFNTLILDISYPSFPNK